ncbi:flavin monooxygenase-like protein [Flagelloscypha sp. PMI_526]|nr:flavin monooxygenase-like protein [Flagelloscypha sp. PMI_526]
MSRIIPSTIQGLVVGAGAAGLTALKNLREVGLSAISLDERVGFGGVWRLTTDPTKTSVIHSTQANLSKQVSCFTDYPFPKDVPNYPSREDIESYLDSYADKFDLKPYIFPGVEVIDVRRAEEKWEVKWKRGDEQGTVLAEKVVIATGHYRRPVTPKIKGSEKFEGVQMHSQAYKDREVFRGKKVVVIGFGPTATDTACDLVGCASQVYISHRHGFLIVPRDTKRGLPQDHLRTMRNFRIISYVEELFPNIQDYTLNSWTLRLAQWKLLPLDPKWKLTPALSPLRWGATVSDVLEPMLRKGDVVPIGAVLQFTGPRSLEIKSKDDPSKTWTLEDVDAIIYGSGYRPTYDLISSHPPNRSAASNEEYYANLPYPRTPMPQPTDLYWNIFDTKYPTSLAYVGHLSGKASAFPMFDVVSMAVAQVFSGQYTLPSHEIIMRDTKMKNKWFDDRLKGGPQLYASVPTRGLYAFLDEAIGSGIAKNLKWWNFWGLKGLIMSGVDTPFIWRLFPGRRKAWDGAEQAIREANVVIPTKDRLKE